VVAGNRGPGIREFGFGGRRSNLLGDSTEVELQIMTANRRNAPRYPSWLPGMVDVAGSSGPIPARVVDLSLGGAALETDVSVEPGAAVNLFIDWGELGLSVECIAIAGDDDALFSVLRVRFRDLSDDEAAVVVALVGEMAAEFHDQQVELFQPGRHRKSNVIAYRGR